MRKNSVLLILIAVSAVALSGCVRIAYIPPEQAHLSHNQLVKSVEIPIAIIGAELKSGRIITFAPPTALYSGREESLVGKDSAGNVMSVQLDSATSVLLCRIDQPLSESYSVPAISFLRETIGRRSPVCDGIDYPLKEHVKLDSGTFDTLQQSIIGRTKEGVPIAAPVASISRVAVEKFTFRVNDKGPVHERFIAPPKKGWTTSLAYRPLEKAKLTHLQTIEALEVPVAIVGAKMASGEVIPFSPSSAFYEKKAEALIRVNSSGDTVKVALDSVAWVVLRRLDRDSSDSHAVQSDEFLLRYADKRPVSLGGARYPFAERVKFDRNWGVLDTIYREISGRAKDSSIVCARFDCISKVGVRKFNIGTTLGKVVLFGGIGVAILALAMDQAMNDMDLTIDWTDNR